MKKVIFSGILVFVVLFVWIGATAEQNFNVSQFTQSSDFYYQYDEMEDSYTILPTSKYNYGDFDVVCYNDGGYSTGHFAIAYMPDYPLPAILTMLVTYSGSTEINATKMIIKVGETRYTFAIPLSQSSGFQTPEKYNIIFTDQSISLLEDIIESGEEDIKFRLSGERDVDGHLVFNKETLSLIYENYISAGGLNQDFSQVYKVMPVTIK